MHDSHLINVLGACSLAVSDVVESSVSGTARLGRSAASAIAVLLQAGPLSVTELGRRIGLSQPAAARMVETLEDKGLVRRRPGPGREVRVGLSEAGESDARQVLEQRSRQIGGLLGGLTDRERETLAALLDKVATNVYHRVQDADLICRLCDREQCVATVPRCPVGEAAGEPADA
jgi:DNA-binding MarR family transcriptional regulator